MVMAVKDIFSAGGKLPGPKKDEGDSSMADEKRDPIAEIQKATYDGERLRAFKRAAGIDEGVRTPATPSRVEEKYGVDIGAMFAAQSKMVTDLLSKINEMGGSRSADPFLKHMEEELKELKEKQEQGQVDPLTLMTQSAAKFDEMAESMKKRLGITGMPQVGAGDMKSLLELEGMRGERDEATRHWQTEMEERRRQWQKEDQRWEQEFKLKMLEFEDKRKTRESAGSALEDLLEAVTESIEPGGQDKEVAEEAPEPKPKAFKCSTCGTMIPYPPPEATEVACPNEKCGTVYDVTRKEAS